MALLAGIIALWAWIFLVGVGLLRGEGLLRQPTAALPPAPAEGGDANRDVPIWSIDLGPRDDVRLRTLLEHERVGANVDLLVGDLDAMTRYYRDAVTLQVLSADGDTATLGRAGRPARAGAGHVRRLTREGSASSSCWGSGGGAPPIPYVFTEIPNQRKRHIAVSTHTGPARAWRAGRDRERERTGRQAGHLAGAAGAGVRSSARRRRR